MIFVAAQDHPDGVFFGHAFVAFVGFAIVWKYMPETKGKTLEEVL